MGRIHSYPFQWVLFLPPEGEVLELSDDTMVVECPANCASCYTTIDYAEYIRGETET